MNRSIALIAVAGLVAVSGARAATELATFDSPNLLQKPTVNPATTPPFRYHQINDGGSFASGTITYGLTAYGITSTAGGYGTGYHNIFTDDLPPPPGSPNNPSG